MRLLINDLKLIEIKSLILLLMIDFATIDSAIKTATISVILLYNVYKLYLIHKNKND